MHNFPKVGELLLSAGVIDELQLKSALAEQDRWGQRLGVTLIKMGMVEENHLIGALAQQLGLPATSLVGRRIAPEVIALVPGRIATAHQVVPLFVTRNAATAKLFLGMEDPSKLEVLDDLCFRTGLEIQPVMMGPTELSEALSRYYGRSGPIHLDGGKNTAGETTIAERSLGLVEGYRRVPAKADVRASEVVPDEMAAEARPLPPASRDNEISLLDALPESSADLKAEVERANRDSEKTRLVVKAITQILVDKGILSLDEIQARIAKLKGDTSSA